VVLNGCETWSLKIRELHRLRMFQNRMLGRIFVPKRDEVTGGWRKLHNEEPQNLCCSPRIFNTITRWIWWAGNVAWMGHCRLHTGFLYESLKERPHYEEQDVRGWIILRWFLERLCGMGWNDLVQYMDQWRALVNTVMNLRVQKTVGKFLSSCKTGTLSRRGDVYVLVNTRLGHA
jgi:hypothetical protein